ncbi:hypothetical protein BOTNAR_0185g00020 [Botryotinia narcissicola]|uniref:Uncharacterized protein n=1 Tax=Botryotinia narcissicola TaxID=278944 RepID=A0A4Z1I9V2_9HELO|nr:hypothetical protein BOTNAR_0185g00020 [Botryotinia narcissicola]
MARTFQLDGKASVKTDLFRDSAPGMALYLWQVRLLEGGYDEEGISMIAGDIITGEMNTSGVYDVRFTCSRNVVEILSTLSCISPHNGYPPGHRSQHKPGTLGPPSTSGKERSMN